MSGKAELPDVDMARLRHLVALTVAEHPEPRRTALVAALERGDASLHDLGAWVGVMVMGEKCCRIHKSRLRRPEAN